MSEKRGIPISACVIAQDEEKVIQECVESLSFCAEVLVLDGGSVDQTRKIARAAGARVETRPFDGFASQRNAVMNLATHEWILSLDADERVSLALRQSIESHFSCDSLSFNGYRMAMQNWFFGRWIKGCGWYRETNLRLFLRDNACWKGEGVHEKLIVDPPFGQLDGAIIHNSYRNLAHYLAKGDFYSQLAAEDLYRRGRRANPFWMVVAPPAKFIKSYILKAGWRDGWRGFVISVLTAYIEFLRYIKYWEMRMTQNQKS